jgi:hypothetical protein
VYISNKLKRAFNTPEKDCRAIDEWMNEYRKYVTDQYLTYYVKVVEVEHRQIVEGNILKSKELILQIVNSLS